MATPLAIQENNAKNIIAILNEIHQMDSSVMPKLINYRVPCNSELAEHPSVQVGKGDVGCEVGFLGILNGLVGIKPDGYGFIGAKYTDEGELSGFVLLDNQ